MRRASFGWARAAALMVMLAVCVWASGCGDDSAPQAGANAGTANNAADAGDTSGDSGADAPDDGGAQDAASDTTDADGDADDDTSADAASDAVDGGDVPDPLGPRLDPEALTTPEEAYEAVDPFIGTGGQAYNYAALTPAAQYPLGMVKLGPDTTDNGAHWAALHHFSGYYYLDPQIRGFSHTHFIGTGVADYGNVRLMPLRQAQLDAFAPGRAYATQDRDVEDAEPGYYTTRLIEPAVDVELTTSLRTGLHRYRFDPGEGPGWIAWDMASSVLDRGTEDAYVQVNGDRLEGWVRYKGGYTGRGRAFTLYISATLSQAPDAARFWDGEGWRDAPGDLEDGVQDAAAGVALRFDDPGEVVVRVGMSFIDLEQARTNREAEVDPVTFDEARARAREVWTERLGRVQVAGGYARDRVVFYTAMYNTWRMPTRLDEVGGRYRGIDGEVHDGGGAPYVTDLSLWDTFRTLHPWYTLADAESQRVCLNSLLAMARQGGRMPRWPAALSYTGGMIGRSADVLFGESAAKGIEGVDYAEAADVLLAEALPDPDNPGERDGLLLDLDAYGYLPSDLHDQSVSLTMEHAYHAHALARLARAQGRDASAELLDARALTYANLYDAETGFFRVRDSEGVFEAADDFLPTLFYDRDGPYTEGTAWHWLFYVPHDLEGLVALAGGEEAFMERLETYFEESAFEEDSFLARSIPDFYYWHANQPPLHTAYFFARLGRFDRLARWVRAIQYRVYRDATDGLAGNDDGGTLSAWYLFSALGVFPIAGTPHYTLSPPVFTRAVLHLDGADTPLVFEAPDADRDTATIEAVEVNGVPLDLSAPVLIDHATLAAGGEIRFTLGASPSADD